MTPPNVLPGQEGMMEGVGTPGSMYGHHAHMSPHSPPPMLSPQSHHGGGQQQQQLTAH